MPSSRMRIPKIQGLDIPYPLHVLLPLTLAQLHTVNVTYRVIYNPISSTTNHQVARKDLVGIGIIQTLVNIIGLFSVLGAKSI